MSKVNDGGAAFPKFRKSATYPHDLSPLGGISLRDYFAAKALAGVMADPEVDAEVEKIAAFCYEMADAMLKARGAV